MALPTTDISFSLLYNSWNSPDHTTEEIKLSDFRGYPFTNPPDNVPLTGEISIEDDFAGKVPGVFTIPEGIYQIGNGTEDLEEEPFSGRFNFSQTGFIYNNLEIFSFCGPGNGTMVGLQFQFHDWSPGYTVRRQTIKMFNVFEPQLPQTGTPDYNGLTLSNETLVKGESDFEVRENGWVNIVFDRPFNYTQGTNILISWENRNGVSQLGNGVLKGQGDLALMQRSHVWLNNTEYPPSTQESAISNGRANIKLQFITQ